ncbi:hypothetical protein Dimus_009210 [Dionaea muscipula]
MDLQPPQPPPQRQRRPTYCQRHPGQHPTGLCAPCLRERLSLLNPSSVSSASHPSSSTVPPDGGNAGSYSVPSELRRCKTFSGNQCESIGLAYEPRRNSCDVRVRSSLWALFNVEDEGCTGLGGCRGGDCEVESKNLGLHSGTFPVLELEEDEAASGEDEDDHDHDHDENEYEDDNDDHRDEIRPVGGQIRDFEEGIMQNVDDYRGIVDEFEDSKRVKEFIDLEIKSSSKPGRRDFKEIAGSFWIAASVFSRKLRNLRRRQRSRKSGGGENLGGMPIDRLRGRRQQQQLRDTQSEVGDYYNYGFGRRSCDADPRCSVDLGRASVDDGGRMWLDLLGRRSCDTTDSKFSIDLSRASVDGGRASVSEAAPPRCSFEPPRASWDGGYLTGRLLARATTPTYSNNEDATLATTVVYGFDNGGALIQERLNMVNGDVFPYSISDGSSSGHFDNSVSVCSQRQRQSQMKKGFDRCRKKTTMNQDEEEETRARAASNSIGGGGIGMMYHHHHHHGARLLMSEKEMKDVNHVTVGGGGGFSSSLEDDSLGSSESASKDAPLPPPPPLIAGSVKQSKKWGRWSKLWSILGLLQPRNHRSSSKCGEEDKFNPPWKIPPKLVRSYSTSSNTTTTTTPGTTSRNNNSRRKRREDDAVFERYGSGNRSCRYSPNYQSARYSPSSSSSSLDGGLLRFNLTPLKTTCRRRRGRNVEIKGGRLKRSPSMASAPWRLY